MSRKSGGKGGTDVFEDFDPAALVLHANQANQQAGGGDQGAAPAAVPPPRRKRRPRVDPWTRVPFNSKQPRWIRSATRGFADEVGMDLQDVHAAALVMLMQAHGFDLESFRPDPEVSPTPSSMARLARALDGDWDPDEPADQAG